MGQAYQILSDETTRENYDKNGKPQNGNQDEMVSAIDTTVFFNVMFGSTLVEPYVGELWIASIADLMMKDMGANANKDEAELAETLAGKAQKNTEESKTKQKKGEIQIAKYLREKVQTFVDGTLPLDDFAAGVQIEACKIADGSFGTTFLNTIGFQLEVEAEEYIGFQKSHFDGYKAQAKKSASNTSTNFKITGSIIKAANAGRKVYKEVEEAQQIQVGTDGKNITASGAAGSGSAAKTKEEMETEQAMLAVKKLEDQLPTILELAWTIKNTRDIRTTLKHACQKVFADASATLDQRLQRAQAVKVIGSEFMAIGKLVGATKKDEDIAMSMEDIKARAEVAVMTTMAKAQGQEVSEDDTEELIRQHAKMAADRDAAGQNFAGAGASAPKESL